jgi:hypothetical protein
VAVASAPKTVSGAVARRGRKSFGTTDCTADPCNCTGCSGWD